MFTGIVELLGTVESCMPSGPGVRLEIAAPEIAGDAAIGDSIAVNGCCLTAVEKSKSSLAFDVGPESLGRTNLGKLDAGKRVNLERSLRIGDQLGGHFVTGHVDAVGTLERREDDAEWSTCWFNLPARLNPQMIHKGSIAVDGVSLTLVDVERERFSVALIPHTLAVTTLGLLEPGDPVNLETDMLAKLVEKQLQARAEQG